MRLICAQHVHVHVHIHPLQRTTTTTNNNNNNNDNYNYNYNANTQYGPVKAPAPWERPEVAIDRQRLAHQQRRRSGGCNDAPHHSGDRALRRLAEETDGRGQDGRNLSRCCGCMK